MELTDRQVRAAHGLVNLARLHLVPEHGGYVSLHPFRILHADQLVRLVAVPAGHGQPEEMNDDPDPSSDGEAGQVPEDPLQGIDRHRPQEGDTNRAVPIPLVPTRAAGLSEAESRVTNRPDRAAFID